MQICQSRSDDSRDYLLREYITTLGTTKRTSGRVPGESGTRPHAASHHHCPPPSCLLRTCRRRTKAMNHLKRALASGSFGCGTPPFGPAQNEGHSKAPTLRGPLMPPKEARVACCLFSRAPNVDHVHENLAARIRLTTDELNLHSNMVHWNARAYATSLVSCSSTLQNFGHVFFVVRNLS